MWWARQESNLHLRLRRSLFYPLNYEPEARHYRAAMSNYQNLFCEVLSMSSQRMMNRHPITCNYCAHQ